MVENIYISIELQEFVNKGVYQKDISSSKTKYYKVSRETWMSDEDVIINNKGIRVKRKFIPTNKR